jgi:hypothetical protein
MNQTKSMKTAEEILTEIGGNYDQRLSRVDAINAMDLYASQFKPEPGEGFTREDMAKMYLAGWLNRPDCTIDELARWLPVTQARIDAVIELIQSNREIKI